MIRRPCTSALYSCSVIPFFDHESHKSHEWSRAEGKDSGQGSGVSGRGKDSGQWSGERPVVSGRESGVREWDVKSEDIVLETKATDTKDHPIYVKKIVGKDRFILVTSASHMPRAMALFRKHGMEPIAAPTDYMVKEREGVSH